MQHAAAPTAHSAWTAPQVLSLWSEAVQGLVAGKLDIHCLVAEFNICPEFANLLTPCCQYLREGHPKNREGGGGITRLRFMGPVQGVKGHRISSSGWEKLPHQLLEVLSNFDKPTSASPAHLPFFSLPFLSQDCSQIDCKALEGMKLVHKRECLCRLKRWRKGIYEPKYQVMFMKKKVVYTKNERYSKGLLERSLMIRVIVNLVGQDTLRLLLQIPL